MSKITNWPTWLQVLVLVPVAIAALLFRFWRPKTGKAWYVFLGLGVFWLAAIYLMSR
jgi:hypothetical protein